MKKDSNKPECEDREASEHPVEGPDQPQSGITRRGFLASIGAGAAVAAAGVPLSASAADAPIEAEETTRVTLLINGRKHQLLVEPRWSLLHVIREKLGITGTKPGCERGECGACTVLIDGRPRYACLTLAIEVEGTEITTVEGLMTGEKLGPVQQAFLEEDAYQCGYCTSGQIMAVEGLLKKNASPSPGDIRLGVSGNLCRCGSYSNIFKAAAKAARSKAGKGGAS